MSNSLKQSRGYSRARLKIRRIFRTGKQYFDRLIGSEIDEIEELVGNISEEINNTREKHI